MLAEADNRLELVEHESSGLLGVICQDAVDVGNDIVCVGWGDSSLEAEPRMFAVEGNRRSHADPAEKVRDGLLGTMPDAVPNIVCSRGQLARQSAEVSAAQNVDIDEGGALTLEPALGP